MCLRGELVFLRAELDANGMSTNVMKLGVETEAKIYIYTQMHAHSLCIDMCTHLSIYPTLYLSHTSQRSILTLLVLPHSARRERFDLQVVCCCISQFH